MRHYKLNRLREPGNWLNFHVKYNSNNTLEVTQKLYLVAHKQISTTSHLKCIEKWYEPFIQNTGLLLWEFANNMKVCDIRRDEHTKFTHWIWPLWRIWKIHNYITIILANLLIIFHVPIHLTNVSMFQCHILSTASFIGICNKFANFKLRIYKNKYKIIYIYIYCGIIAPCRRW
jgi:hypothetical protein